MSAAELAALIQSALVDELDTDDSGNEISSPRFINVDLINGEPGTLGVEASDGTRFFVVVEAL